MYLRLRSSLLKVSIHPEIHVTITSRFIRWNKSSIEKSNRIMPRTVRVCPIPKHLPKVIVIKLCHHVAYHVLPVRALFALGCLTACLRLLTQIRT